MYILCRHIYIGICGCRNGDLLTKQIQITDEVYDVMFHLKERFRCRSFTELFRKFGTDMDTRDLLAHELTQHFRELKEKVVHSVLDGHMADIFEYMRVITVKLAKMHPSIRRDSIDEATEILQKAMGDVAKLCNKMETKRLELEKDAEKRDLESSASFSRVRHGKENSKLRVDNE